MNSFVTFEQLSGVLHKAQASSGTSRTDGTVSEQRSMQRRGVPAALASFSAWPESEAVR